MADLANIGNELLPAQRARMPALPAPELSVDYLARIKEILEILLGQRGSSWDRAVTFRDLQTTGLIAPGSGPDGLETGGMQATLPQLPIESQVQQIDALIRETRAYKSLLARIGSAESYEGLPGEIRAQLEPSLAELARTRRAELRTIEQKIENERISLASRLQEVTASIGRAASGVRSFSAAYADDLQAMAVRIDQLAAQLEGVGSAEIEERLEVLASAVEGLRSQYTLKVQTNPVNGQPPVIAGIALSAESPIAGPGTSSLIFMAEAIAFLTASGSVTPFSVLGDVVTMTNVVLGAGGSFRQGQTAYDTGNGLFLGDDGSGNPVFSMRAANGGYLRFNVATEQFDLHKANVTDPWITSNFSVALAIVDVRGNPESGSVTFDRSPTFTNGSGNYSYTWILTTEGPPNGLQLISSPGSSFATIQSTGASGGVWRYGSLQVTVKDESTGATDTAETAVKFQHGSVVEP